MSAIYRLQGKTMTYHWGMPGDISKVAAYAKASGTDIDTSLPYAELWMGTHPNAPSHVLDNDKTTLADLIKKNPSFSTDEIYKQYNGDLPFLFKIQSVGKALSIQAHPDKELGARLFKEFPENYKDPNHKPEMALALTPFETLFGFRPLKEIAHHMEKYFELKELVGQETSKEFLQAVDSNLTEQENKALLKKAFSNLMKSKQDNVAASLSKLIARLVETKADDSVSQLLVRLDCEYPGGDVGVFSSLFLNHVFLQPGEAIFLAANEPHAYLSGDLVECMATSDNVVRAGLTPKFKDVDVLVSMLTYRYGSADSQKMTPVKMGDHTLLYDPPIEEFSVALTKVEVNQTETHEPLAGPSIIIATSGSGTLIGDDGKEHVLDEGYIYFVGANTALTAKTIDSNLQFYRAFTIPTQ